MNPENVHDLDEGQREPEYIKFRGKQVDISFIPCGISIPMMNKYDEYFKSLKEDRILNEDGTVNKDAEMELSRNTQKAANNLKLMIEIISLFTEFMDEEMTQAWVEKNLTIKQVPVIMSLLVKAITKDITSDGGGISKKKENGSR